jgi:hypothetical protein
MTGSCWWFLSKLCCPALVQVGELVAPKLMPFNVWGDVGSDLPVVDNFSEVRMVMSSQRNLSCVVGRMDDCTCGWVCVAALYCACLFLRPQF